MKNLLAESLIWDSTKKAFASRHLFAVGEHKRSGLILCKTHYAEFAGPGAAICNPSGYEYAKIIAIGSPEIIEMATYDARQKAYSRRIQWVRWLNKIVSEGDASHRTESLFAGFAEFFGGDILASIPTDALALLAGVLPQTIEKARSQHPAFSRNDDSTTAACVDVYLITSNGKAASETELCVSKSPLYSNFTETRIVLPCFA
ncbi:hypothetical protein OsccyDRAFT_1972 [Leptolyngbyaceae cyanobacterium JSC-12]|nr:hypothetical protein OsccyDRAFT_1972 [Leptolyngbyaceae cyanobacterium JSC-12]